MVAVFALAALSLLALSLAGCRGEANAAGAYTLRYATPYPPQHPFSRADKAWIEHIHAASQDALRIEPFWSGSLTSADQSLIELRHGVADVGTIQPIYARGGAHVLRTQAGFYAGAAEFEQQTRVYKCLARSFPALARELEGLRVLAVQGGNLPGVVTRDVPVRSMADLVGLRLRAPSELTEVLRSLGADPVSMPMGDVYASLAKGVIDGVVAPPDALRALHLAEVARHFTELQIPRGAYPSRAISERSLARLPPELAAIVLSSTDVWEAALAKEVKRAAEIGEQHAVELGMQFDTLPAVEQERFGRAYAAAAESNARGLAARGVDGTKMLRSAQGWIARLRANGEQPTAMNVLCPSS